MDVGSQWGLNLNSLHYCWDNGEWNKGSREDMIQTFVI